MASEPNTDMRPCKKMCKAASAPILNTGLADPTLTIGQVESQSPCTDIDDAMEVDDIQLQQEASAAQPFPLLDLPEICIHNITSFLDKSDWLQLLATCRTVARHVMTAHEILKKQPVWFKVGSQTGWLGFKQVMSWAHTDLDFLSNFEDAGPCNGKERELVRDVLSRTVDAQDLDAAAAALDCKIAGVRDVYMQDAKYIRMLPGLWKLCPNARRLCLSCQVSEPALKHLLRIPVLDSLTVWGLHCITTDFSQHTSRWKALTLYSDTLDFKSLGLLPLHHLERPIEWRTPNTLQCVKLLASYSPNITETVQRTAQNLALSGHPQIKATPAIHFLLPYQPGTLDDSDRLRVVEAVNVVTSCFNQYNLTTQCCHVGGAQPKALVLKYHQQGATVCEEKFPFHPDSCVIRCLGTWEPGWQERNLGDRLVEASMNVGSLLKD